MFVEMVEEVIKNDCFFELDIFNAFIFMIKQSFEEEVYWYIYGCFDLVGGFDGKFIKLLEFNVDIFIMFYEIVVI